MRRALLALALLVAFSLVAKEPEVTWEAPVVDLQAHRATFYLPDLPPGQVIDHAVVVRDGEEIGPADGNIDLGLLTYDCELWVRVYLAGPKPKHLDGPHVLLNIGGGKQA